MRFFNSFSSTFLLGCLCALRDVLWKLCPDSWRCMIIWRALSTSPFAIDKQYLISVVVVSGNSSCKRSNSSRNKSQFESVDPLPSLVSDKCWMRLLPLPSVHSLDEIEWVGWRPRNFSSGIKSVKLKDLKEKISSQFTNQTGGVNYSKLMTGFPLSFGAFSFDSWDSNSKIQVQMTAGSILAKSEK